MTPEEHIAQEKRREAFQRSLQAKLRAPAGPFEELKKKWEPLLSVPVWPRRNR
jgi:hypothetical protein